MYINSEILQQDYNVTVWWPDMLHTELSELFSHRRLYISHNLENFFKKLFLVNYQIMWYMPTLPSAEFFLFDSTTASMPDWVMEFAEKQANQEKEDRMKVTLTIYYNLLKWVIFSLSC